MATDFRGFGFAPGHYLCRCIECPDIREVAMQGNRNQFQGAKGSYRCETHATAAKARHEDNIQQATELARPGLMIVVGDGGLRITGIVERDYGHSLHITALTKGGEAIEFEAKRIFARQEPEPIKWAGVMLIRCRGGRDCRHGPKQCTADPDYQAWLASGRAI